MNIEKDEDYPFCMDVQKVAENNSVFAIKDDYPVTDGHHLIIPFRHTENFFLMTEVERSDATELIRLMKNQLEESDSSITGFNIGMNSGESAGQTVMHSHIHLIPRRDGDTEKPRGGVRGVIPEKMDYNSAFKRHIEYYHDGQIKEEGFYNKHLPNYFGTGDAKEGEWKTYYKNGQIKSKGRYVNDVWDGKWVYWSENGTIIKEETWRDKDIWDGEAGVSYKAMPGFGFNTPGNKYSKGMKKNGKKIGLWTFWSRDGEKSWKCEFKDDKPWNGTYRETYHTAEKLSEGDYKEGKKVGVWKNWYGHGELSSSGKYLKGKKEGTWTYFSENGVESWTLEYKNGEPMDGLWVEYGYPIDVDKPEIINRKKRVEGYLKNGKRIDEWKSTKLSFDNYVIIKYRDGKPWRGKYIELINYRDDEKKANYLLQCEKYYNDGVLISEKYFDSTGNEMKGEKLPPPFR